MKLRVFSRTLCASVCYLNFIRSPKSSNPHALVQPTKHTHTHTLKARGLILKKYSLTDVRAASLIRLAGKAAGSVSATTIPSQPESWDLCLLELTWLSHIWSASQRGRWGISACTYVCAQIRGNTEVHFHGKEGSDGVRHIVYVSFPPKEHTVFHKWAVILCHCVCLSMKSLRNVIITLPDRHFSEIWA